MTTIILLLLLPVYIILFWLVKITLEKQKNYLNPSFLNIGDSLSELNLMDDFGNNLNHELNDCVLFFVKQTCGSCKQVLSSIDNEKALILNKKVVIISSEIIDKDLVNFQAFYVTNNKIFNSFNVRIVPSAIYVKNGKIVKSIIVKHGNDLINLLPQEAKVS